MKLPHSNILKIYIYAFSLLLFLTYGIPLSLANNLSISNASLEQPDASQKTSKIQFDLSWENSWRNNSNYDSVWIFAKYSIDSGLTWKHATLKFAGSNPYGFSIGNGTQIEILVPADKKGCFIQRNSAGQGNVEIEDIELVWDWGNDGLAQNSTARVMISGIEMVYIPSGSFWIGDGNGSLESSYAFHENGDDNTGVEITTSSKNISCDINNNDDIDTNAVSVDGDAGTNGNSQFPTGYNSFYIMKYEISEGQWVSYFNSLTNSEKLNRDITDANGKNSDSVVDRNAVSWSQGNAASVKNDRACSFLSWMDLCAYADWAALRPMTELEYEKASRGNSTSAFGEYAWGNLSITNANTISGQEDGTETISNSGANCCYNNQTFSGGDLGNGPLRNGIFASLNSSRTSAGASYYGVMELSGNLYERVVSLGNSIGRNFIGSHGDGTLTTETSYEGNATNSDWPGINTILSRGITGSTGSGLRGGAWSTVDTANLKISDRTNASVSDSARNSSYGGRCVRTAP